MATTIIHKKSSTGASVPDPGDLEPGELAVNLVDKKIYSKTTGGTVIEMAEDQTGAQIKTAYEGESDTNAFTDDEKTKLGILDEIHYGVPLANIAALTAIPEAISFDRMRRFVETSNSDYFYDNEASSGDEAPDDQIGGIGWWMRAGETATSIKTKYESNSDTNEFSDAEKTSLGTMEDNATDDQTNAEIRTAVGAATDSNVYDDAAVTALAATIVVANDAYPKTGGVLSGNATIQSTAPAYQLDETDQSAGDDIAKFILTAGVAKLQGTANGKLIFEGLASANLTQFQARIRGALVNMMTAADFSATEGFLRKTGADAYEAIKSNLGASVNPDADDDADAGYVVGSVWINTTGDTVYQCVDNTNTSAVWKDLSAGAAGGETNTASNGGGQGVGVWDAKSGVDLIFRNLVPASARITIALDDPNNEIDLDVPAASLTVAGAVELATIAETDTGSDATRAVTPAGLAGSALQTKVNGIDTGAKDDQTGAEIKTAYEAEANAYTDTKNTKLGTIEDSATADQTNAEIRAAVAAATDSNVFDDADVTKFDAIEALADVTDTTNVTAAGAAMLGGAGMTVGSTHFNVQTGTSYTLVAGDNGKTVTLNNAATIVLTVPAGLGAGFRCTLLQLGTGQVTVTASGTTLNSLSGNIKIAGQHGVAGLLATVSNTFALAGDLVA